MGEKAIITDAKGALSAQAISENFSDIHPPLTPIQARDETQNCLYCYDAPCINACPTGIDIPTFIRQISTDNIKSAAMTILSENIMGGTCARACPTEILCEQACVKNHADEPPVSIGQLQRFAVDHLMAHHQKHPFKRAKATGKKIAIIGAGPAGLSCAHKLATLGHEIDIYEKEPKAGGLNEYGLAAYKMVDEFAAREVAFILEVGGIKVHHNQTLGKDISLETLQWKYDAVFISIGLSLSKALNIKGEDLVGVRDALDFIKEIRQSKNLGAIKIGNDIVVIGGGNTAIDAAVQAKRLGAKNVSLVYRRGSEQMSATAWEQDLAAKNHIHIYYWASPHEILGSKKVEAINFIITQLEKGKLTPTGETLSLRCDTVLKAIGQSMDGNGLDGIELEHGKIKTIDNGSANLTAIFAGGDCINQGEDLTVQAVQHGKQTAKAIHKFLQGAK